MQKPHSQPVDTLLAVLPGQLRVLRRQSESTFRSQQE